MNSLLLSWQHQDYDPGLSGTYRLHTIAGVDGCSCAVTDSSGPIIAIRAWDFSPFSGDATQAAVAIEQLANSDLFGLDYAQRISLVSAPRLNLVPRRFFDPEQLPVYFNLLLQDGTYTYGASELPEEGVWAVYALEPDLERSCASLFGEGELRHLANILIPAFISQSDAWHPEVCIHVRSNQVYIGVVERRILLYFHCFSFSEAADFLYFVLLAYEQFRLDPESAPLFVSGDLTPSGPEHRELARYIRHVRFTGLPAGLELPAGLDLPAPHHYFDLFTLVASFASRP